MFEIIGYLMFGYIGLTQLEKKEIISNEKSTKKVKKVTKKESKKIKVPTSTNMSECETELTKVYRKQNNLTICLGDLLKEGQKTRIVYSDDKGK